MKTFTNSNARDFQHAVSVAQQTRKEGHTPSFVGGGSADRALVKERIVDGKSLFVQKCPVCEPVRQGFLEYGNAPAKETPATPAEGKGLPKDIVDDLKSPTRLTQLKALERLVDRYVSRHYERLKMSAEERQAMHSALEDGKKQGMEMKQYQKDFGDFCPSCNGASGAN